jgi:hypothetical protein
MIADSSVLEHSTSSGGWSQQSPNPTRAGPRVSQQALLTFTGINRGTGLSESQAVTQLLGTAQRSSEIVHNGIARAERYRIGHEPVLALMRRARSQFAETLHEEPCDQVAATFIRDLVLARKVAQ